MTVRRRRCGRFDHPCQRVPRRRAGKSALQPTVDQVEEAWRVRSY
jgi:hypothetical protein